MSLKASIHVINNYNKIIMRNINTTIRIETIMRYATLEFAVTGT